MDSRSFITCLALALLVLPAAAAQPCKRGFSAPDRIVTEHVDSAVYGDFDEDGLVDVAFTNGSQLGASMNRGGGVFEPTHSEALPNLLSGSCCRLNGALDRDHDGHLDLIFVTPYPGWARGRGDGTFETAERLRLAGDETSFHGSRFLDFDHDGFVDLAAWSDDAMQFFRSAEDGTLALTKTHPFSRTNSNSISVGDFDGDGDVDIASVLFGGKTGRVSIVWSAATPTPAYTSEFLPSATGSYGPVDLDGDGKEELVGTATGALVALRFEKRTLTRESFPFPNSTPAGRPVYPAVSDIDGDGRDDLVFAHHRSLGVARGIDTGRFAEPVLIGVGGAKDFSTADVDGNGLMDVVTTRGDEGLYVIYAGSAADESPSQRLFPLTFEPSVLQLADIDGDGLDDVIANGADVVSVLLNDGAGFFRLTSTLDVVGGRVVIADFDGDSKLDLASGTYDQTFAHPAVMFGDGSGQFAGTVALPLSRIIGSLRTATPGAEVLVVQNNELRALRVTRQGEMTATRLFAYTADTGVLPFDLDGDGIDEIAMGTSSGVDILAYNGSDWTMVHQLAGTWHERKLLTITSADLNGDHVDDLFAHFEGDDFEFYARDGSSYRPRQSVGDSSGLSPDAAALADVDGDHYQDIIFAVRHNFGEPGTLQVLRNDGLGAFTPYNTSLTGPPYGGRIVVTDLDSDGTVDVLRPVFDGVEVHRIVCVTPRLRVAAVPRRVTPGNPVKLIVHALSTDETFVGGVTIKQNGAVVAQDAPQNAYDYATTVWTSEALPEGRHVFTIDYADQLAGPSSTTLMLDVTAAPPRRRTVRH